MIGYETGLDAEDQCCGSSAHHIPLAMVAAGKSGLKFRKPVRVTSPVAKPPLNRWIFKATVYKTSKSRGSVGYGDADPSNVSPLVRGAEMRVAGTRAVSRALRKAYGIGLCSVEELGWTSLPPRSPASSSDSDGSHSSIASRCIPREALNKRWL